MFVTGLLGTCALLPGAGQKTTAGSSGIRLDAGSLNLLKSHDINFLIDTAQQSAAGIRMGNLAAQHAADPKVQALGRQLATEQGTSLEQLRILALDRHTTLPQLDTAGQQSAGDKLSALRNEAFDRRYLSDLREAHRRVIRQFRKEARKGQDPGVQAYASQTLPRLEMRLEQIESLRKSAKNKSK